MDTALGFLVLLISAAFVAVASLDAAVAEDVSDEETAI
jgi:hypothetical protein